MIRLQKFLLLVFALLTVDVLAASAQDARERKRQRERQMRYNQLKRKQQRINAQKSNRPTNRNRNRRTNSRSGNRGGSSSRHSSRKAETKKTPPSGYSVPEKGVRYVFLLEMKRKEKNEIFGGVASFRRRKLPNGKTRLEIKDNIIPRSTTDWKKWAKPPVGRAFLPSKIKFGLTGKHPSVDGKMQLMMGNPADWFFPPLPKDPGDSISRSYKVKKMTMFGSSFKGEHNSGLFKWSVKSGGGTFRDQRFFKTDDDGIQLKGSGSFSFSKRLGMLTRRTFRANINQYDIKYRITLRIMKL